MPAIALSTERVFTPSDNKAAPIRFSKARFHGHERIVIRQSTSWVVIPIDDLDSFYDGIDAALDLTGTEIEPNR